MKETPFFKSLGFKVMLSLAVVAYSFSLLIFVGMDLISNKRQYLHYNDFLAWYAENVAMPIEAHLANQTSLQFNANLASEVTALLTKEFVNPTSDTAEVEKLKITSVAMVNDAAELVIQTHNNYTAGDLGAQLPIKSRDDLSDALVGHYNNGLESISGEQYLYIRGLRNGDDKIIGAIILRLTMPATFFESSFLNLLLFKVKSYGLFALYSLIYILPCGLILIYFISRRFQQRLKQLHSTIEYWSAGDFSKQIKIYSEDELSVSFSRLNTMANRIDNLMQQNAQLASLKERQHLAIELHDTVKQQLFANNLSLASCTQLLDVESEKARQLMQKIIKQNQQIFNQVNGLISTLTQEIEPIVTLTDIEKLIDNWSITHQIAVQKNVVITNDLNMSILKILQRAVSECLQNIVKHANASAVIIDLVTDKPTNMIRLTITDNGQSSETLVLGQGLTLLKDQVEAMGGGFNTTLNNQQESGLRVHLWLPFHQ